MTARRDMLMGALRRSLPRRDPEQMLRTPPTLVEPELGLTPLGALPQATVDWYAGLSRQDREALETWLGSDYRDLSDIIASRHGGPPPLSEDARAFVPHAEALERMLRGAELPMDLDLHRGARNYRKAPDDPTGHYPDNQYYPTSLDQAMERFRPLPEVGDIVGSPRPRSFTDSYDAALNFTGNPQYMQDVQGNRINMFPTPSVIYSSSEQRGAPFRDIRARSGSERELLMRPNIPRRVRAMDILEPDSWDVGSPTVHIGLEPVELNTPITFPLYAGGGRVAPNPAVRRGHEDRMSMPELSLTLEELQALMSDDDFYRSRFMEDPRVPGYPTGVGPGGEPWGRPMGALRVINPPAGANNYRDLVSEDDLEMARLRRTAVPGPLNQGPSFASGGSVSRRGILSRLRGAMQPDAVPVEAPLEEMPLQHIVNQPLDRRTVMQGAASVATNASRLGRMAGELPAASGGAPTGLHGAIDSYMRDYLDLYRRASDEADAVNYDVGAVPSAGLRQAYQEFFGRAPSTIIEMDPVNSGLLSWEDLSASALRQLMQRSGLSMREVVRDLGTDPINTLFHREHVGSSLDQLMRDHISEGGEASPAAYIRSLLPQGSQLDPDRMLQSIDAHAYTDGPGGFVNNLQESIGRATMPAGRAGQAVDEVAPTPLNIDGDRDYFPYARGGLVEDLPRFAGGGSTRRGFLRFLREAEERPTMTQERPTMAQPLYEAPTGNLPAVIDQTGAPVALPMEEMPLQPIGQPLVNQIQQVVQTPLDRRTFLRGAASAAMNASRVGQLGERLAPELTVAQRIQQAVDSFLGDFRELQNEATGAARHMNPGGYDGMAAAIDRINPIWRRLTGSELDPETTSLTSVPELANDFLYEEAPSVGRVLAQRAGVSEEEITQHLGGQPAHTILYPQIYEGSDVMYNHAAALRGRLGPDADITPEVWVRQMLPEGSGLDPNQLLQSWDRQQRGDTSVTEDLGTYIQAYREQQQALQRYITQRDAGAAAVRAADPDPALDQAVQDIINERQGYASGGLVRFAGGGSTRRGFLRGLREAERETPTMAPLREAPTGNLPATIVEEANQLGDEVMPLQPIAQAAQGVIQTPLDRRTVLRGAASMAANASRIGRAAGQAASRAPTTAQLVDNGIGEYLNDIVQGLETPTGLDDAGEARYAAVMRQLFGIDDREVMGFLGEMGVGLGDRPQVRQAFINNLVERTGLTPEQVTQHALPEGIGVDDYLFPLTHHEMLEDGRGPGVSYLWEEDPEMPTWSAARNRMYALDGENADSAHIRRLRRIYRNAMPDLEEGVRMRYDADVEMNTEHMSELSSLPQVRTQGRQFALREHPEALAYRLPGPNDQTIEAMTVPQWVQSEEQRLARLHRTPGPMLNDAVGVGYTDYTEYPMTPNGAELNNQHLIQYLRENGLWGGE